jgi:hypothetical protein
VLDRLARTGYTESDLRVVSVFVCVYQGPPLLRLLHWVPERGVLWFQVRSVRSPARTHSPALVRGVRSPEAGSAVAVVALLLAVPADLISQCAQTLCLL